MRRTVGIVGVVVLVGAGAAPSAGSGPGEFAVGSAKNQFGEFTSFPVQLQVSAHRHGDGRVTGHVHGSGDLTGDLPGGDFRAEGPVTCVRVEPKTEGGLLVPGTRAAIKYVVKSSSGSSAPRVGSVVQVFVEDNGHPRRGEPVDANTTLLPLPPEVSDPETCDDPNVVGQPYNPVDQGNYTLRDDGLAP